jgi:hypothetical protein
MYQLYLPEHYKPEAQAYIIHMQKGPPFLLWRMHTASLHVLKERPASSDSLMTVSLFLQKAYSMPSARKGLVTIVRALQIELAAAVMSSARGVE